MTATNICYNFVGFRCSPPEYGRINKRKQLPIRRLSKKWVHTQVRLAGRGNSCHGWSFHALALDEGILIFCLKVQKLLSILIR